MGALSGKLRDWDSSVAVDFDSAVAGTSASSQVRKTAVQLSIAKAAGKEAASMLWDIATYYETISPATLAEAIVKRNMPPTPTVLSVWGRGAPRVITLKGWYSVDIILPGRSAATGCQSSTSIARAIVGPPLEAAAVEGGNGLTQSVHVDDVAQEATCSETFSPDQGLFSPASFRGRDS